MGGDPGSGRSPMNAQTMMTPPPAATMKNSPAERAVDVFGKISRLQSFVENPTCLPHSDCFFRSAFPGLVGD